MSLTKLNNQSLSAVTSAGLPAGTVLQTVHQSFSQTDVNQTATVLGTLNITPIASNSKLVIFGGTQVHINDGGATNYWHLILRKDTAALVTFGNAVGYQTSAGERRYYGFNKDQTAGNTSQQAFDILCQKSGGAGGGIATNYGGSGSITIMEIAG